MTELKFEIDADNLSTLEEVEKKLRDVVKHAGKILITCFSRVKGKLFCSVKTEDKWNEAEEATLHYEESNSPEGTSIELKLELPGALREEVESSVEDYATNIAMLLSTIADSNGGYDVYKSFMDFATENLYTYTTPANEAKIDDSGGDYPRINVDVKYYG